MPVPYEASAHYYDEIYGEKTYRDEAEAVQRLMATHCPSAATLLEVGCGTGGHLEHLASWYDVHGVDLSREMISVAREKLKGIPLGQADMRDFDLGTTFDVVACLFSVIGYVESAEELDRSIACMARHLAPRGLLIVEPWLTPEQWRVTGAVRGGMRVDRQELKIARFYVPGVEGRFAILPFHHMVADRDGIRHFEETHRMFLATRAECRAAFERAGLYDVDYDEHALPRGAWIGRQR